MPRPLTFTRPVAKNNIANILKTLEKRGPLTMAELAEAICLSHVQTTQYINHLKGQQMIHIGGWTRESVAGLRTFLRAQYKAGPGKDKPRPRPLTSRETVAAMRRRRKMDPDNNEHLVRSYKAALNKQMTQRRVASLRKLQEMGYPPHAALALRGLVRYGPRKKSPTPEQMDAIISMREAGMKWKEISEATGVPVSTAQANYVRLTGGDG